MASTWRLLLLLCFAMAAVPVLPQPTEALGFISIDSGAAEGTTYVDPLTNITYVSDRGFVDSDAGISANISAAYVAPLLARRLFTVRSFPNGTRNCYTIREGIARGSKYLVRAWFLYGNYDGLDSQRLTFDLHLGVNLWKTVNITDPSALLPVEAITVAAADHLWVCLVNTGGGTPFVSSVDVRPLKDSMYPVVNASLSLVMFNRVNVGGAQNYIRYPHDLHDRLWQPWTLPVWTNFHTDSTVQNIDNDHYEVPSVVMQTAASPTNSRQLVVPWVADPADVNQYFYVLHISEIFDLASTDESRSFDIRIGNILIGNLTPDYLYSDAVVSTLPLVPSPSYNITLEALSSSTLPPILNAVEVYSKMRDQNVASEEKDVDAMRTIKSSYQIKKNWVGDPCSPQALVWDGVNCTHNISNLPRITTLDLSSSGLTGEIVKSFSNLGAIEYLDLSYNNLTGTIPPVLAELTSLKVLDLTSNQLNGSIPSALLERSQNGFLTLRTEGNPSLCDNGTSCGAISRSGKKKLATSMIVILCIVPIFILLVVMAIIWRLKRPQGNQVSSNQVKGQHHDSLELEIRQFTYLELKNITNNFNKILGEGGFGIVFFGCLEDGAQVAVKMQSQTASQGAKEFLAEAQHLARVHHRYLVSMVGYCIDGDYLALVIEYMPQGTLLEHLRGKRVGTRTLSWRQRLQIALEAAQGLEYLHSECKPPLIHRDVKSANILLSENLEAKIADFGLSKAFDSGTNTLSTKVKGTPGYLDPEYNVSLQLGERSDVFSFGVVLLELITGQPPILRTPENIHISQRVRQEFANGKIEELVDARLQGNYDINSVWMCAQVALDCTLLSSRERPLMTQVVTRLKESLVLETSHGRTENPVTCSENLEVNNASQTRSGALRIEDIARMSADVSGPSAR
ncbi:putative leucine-rich repeat receptor-like serine/threonine-protein kinase At2g19230 isoform X2 [Zingiber officinale]|uniref:putative leucine-rich repeat receptor-like serine/threonine-protein kinase At2g19230 isoform X2 n=1 Tax=Zingiber officinale TaxID=94328 RepID=UPI001C4C1F97|nr:putative leucine-rich repeat receptor-like serine/threonine-protein kinase At2g19230 isoform X2 [Zingiber officinale]